MALLPKYTFKPHDYDFRANIRRMHSFTVYDRKEEPMCAIFFDNNDEESKKSALKTAQEITIALNKTYVK